MTQDIPPRWDEIIYFVGLHEFITHTKLECKFNLRYRDSREIVRQLQEREAIGIDYNVSIDVNRGGYEVNIKTYKGAQKSSLR